MELFTALLLNGLVIGGIYALIVMGFNLLVLVTGVIHYAYAHIVVLSMYIAWLVIQAIGSLALGLFAAFAAAILFIVSTEFLFRPLMRRRAHFSSLIVSVAMAMVITDILSHFINKGQPISLPMVLKTGWADLRTGMISISVANIITLIGAVIMVSVIIILIYNFQQGRAFRAIAQDLKTARLVGIPIKKANTTSFAIAGLLAGVSAVLLIVSLGSAAPNLGNDLALKALAILLFAGTGNLWGGLIASFILGVAESMTFGYLPGQWSNAIAFGMIAVIIMLKPQGLFGTKV